MRVEKSRMNKLYFRTSTILIPAGLGILLILFSIPFEVPIILNMGIILFSLAGIMVGIEAVLSKKIILRSPYHRRLSETYLGTAAVAQGLTVILIGCFLMTLIIVNYLNEGRNLFQHFIERPGIPFIFISAFCILTSIFTSIGSVEDKQGSKFTIVLNLLASRLLPSIILMLLGIIFFCLGILEIISPQYFDSLGGGFLEQLFLGKTAS